MGYVGVMLGSHNHNGKENESYRDYGGDIGIIRYILGLHKDNGTEHGNYYGLSPCCAYEHFETPKAARTPGKGTLLATTLKPKPSTLSLKP